ncbi:hypothetical protein FRC09_012602 [Ceratobasidium sp. 395]|nr:hypothetical protein FRC09_012602 [Ceratobasidium sp. 395]
MPIVYETSSALYRLPAFKVTGDYYCAGNGLIFRGYAREPLSSLHAMLEPTSATSVQAKKSSSAPESPTITVPWLKTQSKFYGVPYGRNRTEDQMRTGLLAKCKARQDISPKLQELEVQANLQFRTAMDKLENLAKTFSFATTQPEELSRPLTKKRRRAGTDTVHSLGASSGTSIPDANPPSPQVISSNLPTIRQRRTVFADPEPELDADEGLDKNIAESSFDEDADKDSDEESEFESSSLAAAGQGSSGVHQRGSYSAAPDTTKLRARAPRAPAESFLSQLVLAEKEIVQAHQVTAAFTKLRPIEDLQPLVPDSGETFADAFRQKVNACLRASIKSDLAGLESMVSHVELAIWILQVSAQQRSDFSIRQAHGLLGEDNDIRIDQIKHYYRNGRILLRLIYATTVHILPAIAVTHARAFTSRLLAPQLFEIENALRNPTLCDDKINKFVLNLVKNYIVRYHWHACHDFPDGVPLAGRRFGVNIERDDLYIQSLFRNAYKPQEMEALPRGDIWVPSDLLIMPPPSKPRPTHIIKTKFDHSKPENRLFPPQLADSKNQKAIHAWTTQEREHVLKARHARSIEEFAAQLCEQNKTGVKTKGSYARLSSALINETDVLAYGPGEAEDHFIFGVFSMDTGAYDLQSIALDITKHTIGFDDQIVDSAAQGEDYDYQAVHIGMWGRRAMGGQYAPNGTHPRLYMRDNTQNLPYPDQSVTKLADRFDPGHSGFCPLSRLLHTLTDMLQPVWDKLWQYIPTLMRKQETLSDSLGPIYPLECTPFCMVVLNIQAVSRGHRDLGDCEDTICLILALGDFKGGALCVYEPGASIDLKHGNLAAIRSRRMVHFNLDFVGQRFTYVFTSDNGLERWERDRNQWAGLQPLCHKLCKAAGAQPVI